MDYNARPKSAIADLESQSRVNYAATARKWNFERTTLAKRHKSQTIKNIRICNDIAEARAQ
jgi:hypothetical protein